MLPRKPSERAPTVERRPSPANSRFPWRVPLVATVVLGAHAVGLAVRAYERIERLDDVMHALGGFLTAWALTALLPWVAARGWIEPLSRRTGAVLVFGLVAVVVIAWEVLEFGCDRLAGTGFQRSTFDTMSDLILGLAGAALGLALFHYRNRSRR